MLLRARASAARCASAPLRQMFGTVAGREPLLFTPGPLTTSITVKQSMLVDIGSRDKKMVSIVDEIRSELLAMAGVSKEDGFECVLMQGSGTFAVEGIVSSVIPPDGKLLVASNGAYGLRMGAMAKVHGIDHTILQYADNEVVCPEAVAREVKAGGYTHVGVIHHETTAGVLNPVEAIGAAIKAVNPQITFIVDSMSGFGAYHVDMSNVDYLVSSANKNIEGVPGFAFGICRRDKFLAQDHARTISLNMLANWKGLENGGQFRFTPPTHALLAFRQALREHAAEGGVAGRLARYEANFAVLTTGMADLGFRLYLSDQAQGCIISTFLVPEDPNWNFETFYTKLADRGCVIYPGKLTDAECFRLGNIGRLFPADIEQVVNAVRTSLEEMGVSVPVTQKS